MLRDEATGLINRGDLSSSGRKHPIFAAVLYTCTFLIAAATCVGVFVYGTDLHSKANTILSKEGVSTDLPSSFVLPDSAMTPAKDQAQRGTCWIFSTMGVIESSYRKHGIEKGWLESNEYVSFSEQAYGIGFVNYCLANKSNDKFCFAGPASGSPTDGEPEWLYYMNKKVTKYILPTAVCPYQKTEAGALVCEEFDSAVSTNPISVNVKSVHSVYSIDAIKRLLYEKQVALAWSHAVYEATYVVPCSDKNTGLNESDDCKTCAHPCKASADGCCAEMVLPGYTKQGVFGMHRWPHQGGGHAMLVVGWNDEFRVDIGLPGQLHQQMTGGLIIKNSWGGDMGHSAAYWAQAHSLADENFICPVEKSSVTWIPANVACMQQTPDPKACAPGLQKIVRKNWVDGATVLKCGINASSARAKLSGWTGCKTGWHYVLASSSGSEVKVTVPAGSDGYLHFHLFGWNPSNTSEQEVIETGASTWYGIENLLTPVTVIGNLESQCGYFFVPYEVYREGTVRFPAEGHDTPVVSYIELDWDAQSYDNSGKVAAEKDYTLLRSSTIKWNPAKFTGPFDWNADV